MVSFYVLLSWFGSVFLLYLIGAYYRVLPFMDVRSLCCDCGSDGGGDGFGSGCIDYRCCNDMNELDELIENEQREIERYTKEDNFDAVASDLIDVEVLDPASNEYTTITVTFRTALRILFDDENNREWKYREKLAVSRLEELSDRYERLGEELTWQSIYPRQCLVFSASALSIALLLVALIQAFSW